MYLDLNDIKIIADNAVKHITRTACMALSGTIENGIVLTANPQCKITIYKDRIDFGMCYNPEISGIRGLIFPNFYNEYGNIVYHYGSNIKYSLWGKTLDYSGMIPPTAPDNQQFFDMIYPRLS